METDAFLHRYKFVLTGVTGLLVGYIAFYFLFLTPYEEFWTAWDPDHQIVVLETEGTAAEGLLYPDDVIIAIDGSSVSRVGPVYPAGQTDSHEFVVVRNRQTLTVTVPFSTQLNWFILSSRLPAILVGFAGWLVGVLSLHWGRGRESRKVGGFFILAGLLIVALQGDLAGVPGAVFLAHPFLFFLPAVWTELGFIPRAEGESYGFGQKLVRFLVFMGVLLGIAGLVDLGFMLVANTSLDGLTGFSLDALAMVLTSGFLLATVVILLYRLAYRVSRYEQETIRLLLFFIALGVLPTVGMTILPAVLFGVEFLPFPIAILLLVFIPAGYFFVINRRGYLHLDTLYVRMITFVLMGLGLFAVSAAILYATQNVLSTPSRAATLIFPLLFLAMLSNRPVTQLVNSIIYGKTQFTEHDVNELAIMLSRRPEWQTMRRLLQETTLQLQVEKALLLIHDQEANFVASIGVREENWVNATIPQFAGPALKESQASVFVDCPWAELALPINIGVEQIGILWFSAPATGQFTSVQVDLLRRLMAVIAMGVQSMAVLASSHRISSELIAIQEQERTRLASDIHDQPLQVISHVLTRLETYQDNNIKTVTTQLRQVAGELRRICVGLHPPVIDYGIQMMVDDAVQKLKTRDPKLRVIPEINLLDPDCTLPTEIAAAFYHVLIEATNNIVKHAAASHVVIRVTRTDQIFHLEVVDDGLGIPDNISMIDLVAQQHLGLFGMFSRAQRVGGKLTVNRTTQGRGTIVSFVFPGVS